MFVGIIYNWKGLKEENYLYTFDEMAKYDFNLLRDCVNNPDVFNDSEKSVCANKTWMGILLKTDEEVKKFLAGEYNEDVEQMKLNNPDNDYNDWYWENVSDNDLYSEESNTMRIMLQKFCIPKN